MIWKFSKIYVCRCLEEGAEDFIVKPVKLSDVKRLKDYMTTTRDVRAGSQDRGYSGGAAAGSGGGGGGGINKRKLSDTSDLSSSPPSISSSTPSSSPSDSSSPSQSPSASPSSSPGVLDSPIRRLKMTGAD